MPTVCSESARTRHGSGCSASYARRAGPAGRAQTIVAAEYGHLRGAGDFLRITPEYEGRFDPRLSGYLSTHPLDAERLAALEALAAERGWSAQGELTPLSD